MELHLKDCTQAFYVWGYNIAAEIREKTVKASEKRREFRLWLNVDRWEGLSWIDGDSTLTDGKACHELAVTQRWQMVRPVLNWRWLNVDR
jgi:hypothetical protein